MNLPDVDLNRGFDTKIVPAYGSPDSPIALVGEAPGADEVDAGQPFVGKAGDMLNRILARVGIGRSLVYITNVVKERPPNNAIEHFIYEYNDQIHTTPEYEQWENWLYEELRKTTCNVLVPLGNVALFALTRQRGISKRRGSVYRCTIPGLEDRKVIPTFHPASALLGRNPLNEWVIQADLVKIQRESRTRDFNVLQRSLRVAETPDEAIDYLNKLDTVCGFDIESSTVKVGSNICTREMIMFSVANSPLDSLAVPLIESNGANKYNPTDEARILSTLSHRLSDPSLTKVGQNLAYDAGVLYHRYGMHLTPYEDTMMAHAILFPEMSKDLGFLCSFYSNTPYYKDWGAKFFKGRNATPEEWFQFLQYSALDSAVVLEIFPKLDEMLQGQGNWGVYRRHIKCLDPILYLTERGFRVDREALKELSKSVTKEMLTYQHDLDELYRAVRKTDPEWVRDVETLKASIAVSLEKGRGVKGKRKALLALTTLNVKSSKQLKEYLYTKKGLCLRAITKDGKTVADAQAMRKLAAKGVQEARLISTIARMRDDKARYYTARPDQDGRMRTYGKPAGTDNGRFSFSKSLFGTGFNYQNQPKRMKQYMLADPGCGLINIDYSQAENRIVAVLAQDQRMMAAFANGEDVHSLTAGLIFGKHPSQVSREAGSSKLGDGTKSERDWGKQANHAFNYGLGPNAFSEKYEIPLSDTMLIYRGYHRAYPNIKGVFWRDVEFELRRSRALINLLGRKRMFLDALTDTLFHVAYNYIPQSTVADMMNIRGFLPVYYEDEYNCFQLCNQVHDSLVLQFPLTLNPETLLLRLQHLVTQMEEPLYYKGLSFVIPADVSFGLNCLAKKELNIKTATVTDMENLIKELQHG